MKRSDHITEHIQDAQSALLFDLQRFSLHDGPGIRTTLFFKGCPLRCRWCQNPESQNYRTEMAFYVEKCVGCFQCREACPQGAIMASPKKRIDYIKCNHCALCASVCEHEALRAIGTRWDPQSLLAEVMKDIDFYSDSGGGVTLSGGEPTAQAGFLKQFLPSLKDEGIHVNLETCGMFSWEKVENILPFLDLIYYDLKITDSKLHKTYTGTDNNIILENFSRLAAGFPSLQARMPVIPGLNDFPENLADTARVLKENRLESLHLLPYHSLWEAKLPRLETEQKPPAVSANISEHMKSAKDLLEAEGIQVVDYD